MDLKEQIIQEYLQQGCGYRKLQAKYGISRTYPVPGSKHDRCKRKSFCF
jgi:hypothetical protein